MEYRSPKMLPTMPGCLLHCMTAAILLTSLVRGFEVKFDASYYEDATLVCDASIFQQTITPFIVYWVIPDGMYVIQSAFTSDDKYISGKPWIDRNVYNLTVRRVDDQDFGWYQCIILWGNYRYLVSSLKVGLNVDGPGFGTILYKYRYAAITTGAALAIIIIIVICCVLQRRRKKKVAIQERAAVYDLDKAIEGFDHIAMEHGDGGRSESESGIEMRDSTDKRQENNVRAVTTFHETGGVSTMHETDGQYAAVRKDSNQGKVSFSDNRVPDKYYDEKL